MAKSKLFRKIHIVMNGRKFRVCEPTLTFDLKPSPDSCYYAEVHMDGIMDGGVVAEFMKACDDVQSDTISLADWERIRINDDVFITTDTLRKALKEYFDKILTTTIEE